MWPFGLIFVAVALAADRAAPRGHVRGTLEELSNANLGNAPYRFSTVDEMGAWLGQRAQELGLSQT